MSRGAVGDGTRYEAPMGWILRPTAWVVGGLVVLAAAGATYQIVATRMDLAARPMPGLFVDVGGHRLHVWCKGKGRPTVVFEAGGLGGFAMFEAILSQISPETRACAYDRAGMGYSEPGPLPRDARRLAAELESWLTNSGEESPYLFVAHSAGGFVVRLFTSRHPSSVAGLVLLDTAHEDFAERMPRSEGGVRQMLQVARLLSRFGVMRLLDPIGVASDPDDPRARRALATLYRPQTWDATASLVDALPMSALQVRESPPLPSRIPIVVIPHGVAGDLLGPTTDPDEARQTEPLWQELQRSLAAASDAGRVVVAEGSGHMITEERPDLVVREVLALLAAVR